MSLYRKYRPQTFSDVVGQDAVVTTLEHATSNGKLAHAYLFAGGRGTGKTSVARILAKQMMLQGIEDEAIQKQIVSGVEDGSLVDLLEIDAASNRGIDDVRDLIEKIQFSPVTSGAKVYIIDEVHMLTKEAFNALLKTLEEPPAYAYFILATTELNKIPDTIQSRCQCFPFRAIPEDAIIRRLQYIADQEKISVDREALRAIAHHVEGGMRDAISFLDQLQSLDQITSADVTARIGGASTEHTEAVFEALNQKDRSKIIEIVRTVEDSGLSLEAFIGQLLSVIRTTLHTAIEENNSTQHLQRMLTVLLNAVRDIRSAPVHGLVLESALLSLCDEPHNAPEAVVTIPKTEKKEATKPATPPVPATPDPVEPVVTIEKESESPPKEETAKEPINSLETQGLSLESIQSSWTEIVNQATPASVKMSLKNGRPVSLEEGTLTVSFASDFHKDKVSSPDAARVVEETVERLFKRTVRLHCVVGEKMDIPTEDTSVNLAEAASEIF